MKSFKKAGAYSMIFKVPTLREEIGDPLVMYSVNHDILPNYPLFIKGGKKISLFLGVGTIVSWI